MAKVLVAALIAALTLVLGGYAAGGQLGNFGAVGVDQAIFGPAVFFWFTAIGAVTVVMTGGVTRRRRPEPAPVGDAAAAVAGVVDPTVAGDVEVVAGDVEPIPDPVEPVGPAGSVEPRGAAEDPEEHMFTDDDRPDSADSI